jgi:hypothetical protein
MDLEGALVCFCCEHARWKLVLGARRQWEGKEE